MGRLSLFDAEGKSMVIQITLEELQKMKQILLDDLKSCR
jgi:hypothetical protein